MKLTRAQWRVLCEMHKTGKGPFQLNMQINSMGGAYRRMIMRLHEMGLLDGELGSSGDWYKSHAITAEGLRAINATASEIYARGELERKRAGTTLHDTWLQQEYVAQKQANRKARIIAKVRKEFGFQGLSGDDGRLWGLIQRIVEIYRVEP